MLFDSFRFLAAGLICIAAAPAVSAQGTLPDNWQSLEPLAFVEAVEAVADGDIDADTVEDVRLHAANELMSRVDTDNDYALMVRLQRIGRRVFHRDAAKMQQIRDTLRNRQDDWTAKSYDEMRAKISLMDYLGMPLPDLLVPARRWFETGGQLAEVWDEDLPMVHFILGPTEIVEGSFSVRWEGAITAPATGNYTFSISPINTSAIHKDYTLQQSMSVTIDGQAVINATPDNWESESEPVSLQADTATPIVVNLSVEASGKAFGVMHAMLYWSGPGVTQTIIPSDRLSPPEGEDSGLQAEYTWNDGGLFKRVTRIDPEIDFSWARKLGLTEDTTTEKQATAAMWASAMSQTALDGFETSEDMHPFFRDPFITSQGLTSGQRQEFLKELIVRPDLLRNVTPRDFWKFYTAFRLGAPEEALDAVGVWAIRHADHCAVMAPDTSHVAIDIYFRDCCRRIGQRLAHESNQTDAFRNAHIEMADGSCCLPTAYILGYSYLTKGQIDEWIAFLDAKLAEPAVTGEQRINWLLARAQAAEIRLGSTKPYWAPRERLLDGRAFIEEAAEAATTSETKCRCAQEIAARLTATHQFDESRAILLAAVSSAPDQEQELYQLVDRVNDVESSLQRAQDERAAEARDSYRKSLISRRERALAAGDSDAVARYDALINAAQGANQPEGNVE